MKKTGPGSERCRPMKDPQGENTEHGHTHFAGAKQQNPVPRKPCRQPATEKAAEAQPQHERTHHHGDGFDVDTVDRKERPLPNNLIN